MRAFDLRTNGSSTLVRLLFVVQTAPWLHRSGNMPPKVRPTPHPAFAGLRRRVMIISLVNLTTPGRKR